MTDTCACCGQSADVVGELTALMSRDDISLCGGCIVCLNRQRGGNGSTMVRTAIPVLLTTDYGIREAAYVDPDGNRIRIGSPLPS